MIDLPLIGISINRFTDLLENAGARSLGKFNFLIVRVCLQIIQVRILI